MTHYDLALLKSKLRLVSRAQLLSLDRFVIAGWRDLEKMGRKRAVKEIIRTLNVMTPERRLHGIAWLYCWLLPRTSVQPWFAVRFGEASVIVRFDEWLPRMATLMRREGFQVTMENDLNDGTIFACFLARDLADQLQEQHLEAFVAMWPGVPLVMMHTTEPRLMFSLLRALSDSVDRAPMLALNVPPGNLHAGFHYCLLELGIELSKGTLEVPGIALATGLPSPRINEVVMQQCIEDWNAAAEALRDRLQS
ncbi:hypothetical protein HPB51_019406 [Rhipicephalus microplus]|uniref:Uncharacterized protein n=1 Tax=Rhipicephalus microplus TaxID=6941 RepID=A0A9J6DBU5_RHIMP|nr:hypothetical protein HPB51_019406 [Rhipicephalus microplus]